MEALGLGVGCNNYTIKTKADAMRYAFDLTTERNYSTQETHVNIKKAMSVYRCFVSNINLPDCESGIPQDFFDNCNALLRSYSEQLNCAKKESD